MVKMQYTATAGAVSTGSIAIAKANSIPDGFCQRCGTFDPLLFPEKNVSTLIPKQQNKPRRYAAKEKCLPFHNKEIELPDRVKAFTSVQRETFHHHGYRVKEIVDKRIQQRQRAYGVRLVGAGSRILRICFALLDDAKIYCSGSHQHKPYGSATENCSRRSLISPVTTKMISSRMPDMAPSIFSRGGDSTEASKIPIRPTRSAAT